jgi:RNA polymerase sigma factor (sigma-70 family)
VADVTVSSMRDARDAEDQRLLEEGQYGRLVESYYGAILDRCYARIRGESDQIAVAGDVVIRLLSELKRGRRYRVPFRVVVHQVTTWKIKEHFAPAKITEVELEEWLAVAAGEEPGIVEEAGFEAWLVGLTELEANVIRMRYEEGLELSEIAVRLGKTPNAVHQIHFRALEKLRREAEAA